MAVVDLGLLGTGSATTAGTTLVITNTTGAIIPAGTLLHITGTWDNINSVTAPTITSSTVGGVAPAANHGAAVGQGQSTTAGSGVWHQCFRVLTTASIASGATIATLTSNQSAVKRVGHARGFSGLTTTQRSTTVLTGASAAGTPSAATSGTALVTGDVVIGSVSSEVNAQATGDADTTNGSWSTIVGLATTGGAANTNVNSGSQAKIVTATGVQTYNPTTSNDSVACVYTLVPAAEPAIEQAAYRFYADGTESGSTALTTANTNLFPDLTSGDLNLGIRIRLQETAGSPLLAATDDWQLQWENNNSGAWVSLGTSPTVYSTIDSYPESNIDSGVGLFGFVNGAGQSFVGNGLTLDRVRWFLERSGAPTGNMRANLYAASGGIPTGTALATSTTLLDAATVSTAGYTAYDFDFDGTFTLVGSTTYFVTVEEEGAATGSGTDLIDIGRRAVTPGHSGSAATTTGSWVTSPPDLCFYVYALVPALAIAHASTNLTDGAATTNRLGAGTGSFVAGKVSEDGLVDDLGWAASNYTELLYSATLKAADLADADILRFRVLRNGSTTEFTYTRTPTIQVTKTTAPTVNATVALVGSSTLTTTGLRTVLPTVALTATSTLTTTGVVTGPATTILNIQRDFTHSDWVEAGTASATATRLTLPPATSSITTTAYSLDEARVFWKVAQNPTSGGVIGGFYVDSDNYLVLHATSGDLYARHIEDTLPVINTSVSWDSAKPYLSLRETGGTVYFERSALGMPGTWETITSGTVPTYAVTGVSFRFWTSAGTGDAWIESLNTPTVLATVALSATSTLTATGTVTGGAVELEVVGTSNYEPTAASGTVVLNVPGGTADGDLMIAACHLNNATAISTPAGWNDWHVAATTALSVGVFWRIADSEPASYSFTMPISARVCGEMAVYRNADITTPEDVASAQALANTTSQAPFPAITPVTDGAWVLAIGTHLSGTAETTSVWSSTNMTVDVQGHSKVPTTTNPTAAIAHAPWTAGAFTPDLTSTLTTARSTSISSVIRPSGAPPPTTVDASVALSASGTLTTNATLYHYTNAQRNSSFEAGHAGWETFGPAAIAFPTDTGEALHGTHVARLTATSAGTPHIRTVDVNRIPMAEPDYGQYLTAYAEVQWETGTPSDCRLDVQFMDSDGTTVMQSNIGTNFTPTTSWGRTKNNDNLIPDGCTTARIRLVIVNAAINDSVLLEDVYAFVGPNIPDAGPDPAWTPHPGDTGEVAATVALTATSTLSATAVREPQASVSLTAASTLTVTGTAFHVLVATVPLTAVSTLTATAVRVPQASVSLTATSTLTANAVRTQPATAALTGVSTLTATGFEQAISAVALVGVSTLTADATITGQVAATVALTAVSTLTATGVRGQATTVALTGVGTLTATAVRAPQASVGMTATSTLTVAAIRSAVPTVALSGASTLTATAVRIPQASVSLVAASTLTATVLRTVLPTVALTGISTLTATATTVTVQSATVALTAASTLTATAVRAPQAAVSLVAGSTLTASAIVDHFVNGQRNSSFEAGRSDWDTSGPAAISFPNNTGLALHGTHVGRVQASSAGTPQMRSTGVNRIPVTGGAGLYLNVYANFRWDTGTIKDCRMDVQFMDPDGINVVQTNIGTLFTPSASAWTRILNNDNLIPVGSPEVRIRFVIPSAETGDALLVEDIYSHLGSNIHNDGPHPAWTPHPEDYWDQPATAALTATSTLTANAVRVPQAAVALTATSTLSVTAVRFGVHVATVPLTGVSTLTANAVRIPQASVSLTAASTLTATGLRTVVPTVALTGTSTLTATGFEQAVGAVPLVAASTLTVNATIVGQVAASVALAATSTLTATAVRTQRPTVGLTAVSTLTATGVKTRPATVALSAASTLTASATVAGATVVVATAALTAASTLTATGVRIPQAAVGLVATSTLTVIGERVRPASVALTATALLTVTGVEVRVTAVTLTAASVLTVTATRSAVATVPLVGTATLTVQMLRIPQASVGLTATSTLLVTATVIVPGPGIANVAYTGFLHALDADMNWYPVTVPQ